MNAICLDAEMTDRGELLELSVYAHTGEETYHRLFKPQRQRTWRTNIHHITPEMVADAPRASQCSGEIAAIVKRADVIIGCAVDNDLRVLADIGVNVAERQHVVDIQVLHFYLSGGRAGTPCNSASLMALTQEYCVGFTEEAAHGASADTDATLRCFYAIMDRAMGTDSRADADATLARAVEVMRLAGAELAKGYLLLTRLDRGYRLDARYMKPKEKEDTVAVIPVDDRHIAEYELRRMLARRVVPGMVSTYALRPADLRMLQTYRCVHDPVRSEMCRKLLKAGF